MKWRLNRFEYFTFFSWINEALCSTPKAFKLFSILNCSDLNSSAGTQMPAKSSTKCTRRKLSVKMTVKVVQGYNTCKNDKDWIGLWVQINRNRKMMNHHYLKQKSWLFKIIKYTVVNVLCFWRFLFFQIYNDLKHVY